MNDSIIIRKIEETEIDTVIKYVQQCRKKLFPMLDSRIVPRDLQYFKETYIDDPLGSFLLAKNVATDELIGSIGMNRYDNRCRSFSFKNQQVVELARLHINLNYRRRGIASNLAGTLLADAKLKSIDILYLHTHPFLEGAIEFWEKHQFTHICETIDSDFITKHMQRSV